MNNQFLRKFNELTDDKFSYIKVSQINVNVAEKSVEVILLYPAKMKDEIDNNYDYICQNVVTASKIKAKPIITLKSSVFDFEYCKRLMFEFFRAYPTVAPFIRESNFAYSFDGDKVLLSLDIEASASEYCQERNVGKEVEVFLDSYFTDKIVFSTRPLYGDNSIEKTLEEFENNVPEFFLEFEGGRYITPENVEEFIGKIIYDKAMYIEDCNPAMAEQSITVCGNIRGLKEVERTDGKANFIKFEVEDYTSRITCLAFPTKYNPIDKLRLLQEGKSVVVKGTLSVKEYRGQQNMSIFVRNLSLCTLPQKFEKNEIIRKVANSYQTIFPEKYVEEKQGYLFEEVVEEDIAPQLIGKTYVVFDFETTGLDTRLCKITEIGAVKVVDGIIKETFSTLIDPHEPLTELVKSKTHITDEMLEGKPSIEDVMPDFHKFCDGCVLVGQNSNDFDMKILNRIAGSLKFKFPEEHEDTMLIARSNIKLRNYQLGTMAKHFGVVNENAHRALDDALTTAKIFIKLAKFL